MGAECRRGLGVAFRNHEGKLMVTAVKKVHSNMGVKEAELAAACFAMEVVVRMGV